MTLKEREKDFLSQNNLGTPNPFRLKSGQNAEISHTNHICRNKPCKSHTTKGFPRRILILWNGGMKSN